MGINKLISSIEPNKVNLTSLLSFFITMNIAKKKKNTISVIN